MRGWPRVVMAVAGQPSPSRPSPAHGGDRPGMSGSPAQLRPPCTTAASEKRLPVSGCCPVRNRYLGRGFRRWNVRLSASSTTCSRYRRTRPTAIGERASRGEIRLLPCSLPFSWEMPPATAPAFRRPTRSSPSHAWRNPTATRAWTTPSKPSRSCVPGDIPVRYHIAGDGPDAARLRHLAETSGVAGERRRSTVESTTDTCGSSTGRATSSFSLRRRGLRHRVLSKLSPTRGPSSRPTRVAPLSWFDPARAAISSRTVTRRRWPAASATASPIRRRRSRPRRGVAPSSSRSSRSSASQIGCKS